MQHQTIYRLIDSLVIILTSLIIFTLFLGSYQLITPDEGRYVEIAREMVASGNYVTPQLNGSTFLDKPILFYWVEIALIKLFGLHEWSVRLLPAMFGSLGCLFTYFAGERLFSRRTGLFAAFLQMSTLIYFFSAHYTNMDLMVAVLISGALYATIIGLKATQTVKQRTLYLWAAYALAALAFLTKGLIGIVLPGLIIGIWLFIHKDGRNFVKLRIFSGLVLFLIITTPWIAAVTSQNPDFLHYFFIVQQFDRFTGTNFNVHQPLYFYVIVLLVGLIPWVVFLFQSLHYQIKHARHPQDPQRTIRSYLLIWPAVIFIFFSIPDSKVIGYILPAIPPLLLLIANFLDERSAYLVQSKSLKTGACLFLALSAIISFALIIIAYMPHITAHQAIIWLTIIAAIIMLGGVRTVYCAFYKEHLTPTVRTLFITVILAFVICVASVATFKMSTIKPLANTINRYHKQGDLIVTYRDYFQDLPVYVRHRVYVVYDWKNTQHIEHTDNWKRDLAEDILYKHYRQHNLITDQQFLNLWQHKHLFVVLKEYKLSGLKKIASKAHRPYHIVKQHQNYLLVTNFNLKNHTNYIPKNQASIHDTTDKKQK